MNIKNYTTVITHIEQHPEKWDQSYWCGTPCCFAGHAQLLAGLSANESTVMQDATQWLGLPARLADWVFQGHRTLYDFRKLLDWQRAGEIDAAEAAGCDLCAYATARSHGVMCEDLLSAQVSGCDLAAYGLDRDRGLLHDDIISRWVRSYKGTL